MDIVDRDLEKAERDASPGRFQAVGDNGQPVERAESRASSSSSSSSGVASATDREEVNMARAETVRDQPSTLERHATAMTRIETQRSQHLSTVGASLKSRKTNKPLPEFGAGKPYPPPLPEREEYVVEFDGADDPLHAQNWPFKRK